MNATTRLVGSIFFLLLFSLSKMTAQCVFNGQYNGFNLQQTTFQMYYSTPNAAVAVPNPYYAYGAWMNENIEDLAFPANKDNTDWLHIAHDFGTASTPPLTPIYLFTIGSQEYLEPFF
jgi:hypothetical protein